jgi:hypothetical protein
MARDLPVEQNIFHLWAAPYVVDNQVASRSRRFAIHYDADVRYVASEIPSYQIPRRIVLAALTDRKLFSFTREERHQIRDAAVIDIRVGMCKEPAALIRIGREILQHILVNFFLQIDANDAVYTDNFIGADACSGRDVPVWVRNPDVSRIITNNVVRPFYGCVDEFLKKLLACW